MLHLDKTSKLDCTRFAIFLQKIIEGFMESIRINISKQLSNGSLVPIIAYPAEAAYDFRVHNFSDDMKSLAALKAYEMRVYPDGYNTQLSLIKDIQGGFIQYAILVDTSKLTILPRTMTEGLRRIAAAYETIASNDPKPSSNPKFQKAIADIYKDLTDKPQEGLPKPLPIHKEATGERLTYYMKYKTEGEVETLLSFPNQEFFHNTDSIFLIPTSVQPANPKSCRQVHSLVRRTFKIVSADGYEYGEVKEGEVKRINLRGKEGMLPMTIDVKGDITNPSHYGYYDTAGNVIRIDERGIKFYYELKFFVKHKERTLRGCTIRHNGEQLMPDNNGCYLIKIYENDINNAGVIHFSGENFKEADIRITPGIVKQQEYIFVPEPTHDSVALTLDFNDGRAIHTNVDVGTDDRLFQQLEHGRVKGYNVKKEGSEYKMFIPRKLTKSSKNILRLLKAFFMIAFTLAAYSLATYLMTEHWPWPIERIKTEKRVTRTHTTFDKTGTVATEVEVEEEDIDDDEITTSEDTDQVKLEAQDIQYLTNNDIWRRDSIESKKYMDVINTVFNGNIYEIRTKAINDRIIPNSWWQMIWKQVMLPNSIHRDKVKAAFYNATSTDRTTLNVKQLYEELSTHLHSSDGTTKTPSMY